MIKPYSARMDRLVEWTLKLMNRVQRWCFIRSDGRFGKSFFGAPVGLLTTTGRKSGLKRQVCLVYYAEGDAVAIVGSKAGCADHPVWYLNLKASPQCHFQRGRDVIAMLAHDAEGEEYEHFWQQLTRTWSGFDTYKALVDGASGRQVPLVILKPAKQ